MKRRGRSGLRVVWTVKTQKHDAEGTWCQNHQKLFVHCGQRLDVSARHCGSLMGHWSCVARQTDLNEGPGDLATTMGDMSDDPDTLDRMGECKGHVDRAGNMEEPCSEEELQAKEGQ